MYRAWLATDIDEIDMKRNLIHSRLGHPGRNRFNNCVSSMDMDELKVRKRDALLDDKCEVCIKAKQVKAQSHKPVPRARHPLKRVYMDFWGPNREGIGEERYYLSLIDDYMRYSWLFLAIYQKTESIIHSLEVWLRIVVQAPQLAEKVGDQRPVTILLDSQAAIARLRHTQPGPGQVLVTQAHAIAKRLHVRGRQPTIQWVTGHAGVEWNEKADQAAKQAASKPPGKGPREISLAFACRARTEAITTQRQRWLTKELGQRSQQCQRIYRPQKNWRLDPAVAMAPKHLASRYFQLKSGHAAIGAHLHQIRAQEDATCEGCGISRETTHHLFFEFREWRHQRNMLYKDLETDGVMRHYCRRIPTRTTFWRAQSYQGAATIPSQYQHSSTASTPTANGGKGPKR